MKMIPFKNEKSVFSPEKYLSKAKVKLPENAIITWHYAVLNEAIKLGAKPYWDFVGGLRQTVYIINIDGKDIAVAQISQGGPNVAPFIEEAHVLGVKNFIFVGSCGLLTDDIGTKLIVPEKALRDEGLSYHYTSSEDEFITVKTADFTCSVLDKLNVPYVKGNTWTTDAPYRETESAINTAKEKGCLCVEMECASLMAVCDYLKIKACQFLFTADRLNDNQWHEGSIFKANKGSFEIYFSIALAILKSV